MDQFNRIAAEWLAAVEVISGALQEWGDVAATDKAAAIIARLAAHDPPILLEMQEPSREDQTQDHDDNKP